MTSTLATVRRFSDAGPRFERRKPRTPREVHLPRLVSSSPHREKTLLGTSRRRASRPRPERAPRRPASPTVPFPSDALVTFPIRIRAWNGSPRRRCPASRTARSRPFPRLGRHPPRCRPTATRRFARAGSPRAVGFSPGGRGRRTRGGRRHPTRSAEATAASSPCRARSSRRKPRRRRRLPSTTRRVARGRSRRIVRRRRMIRLLDSTESRGTFRDP